MNEKEIKYMQRSKEDKGGVLGPLFFLFFFAIPLTSYYFDHIILQKAANYKYISYSSEIKTTPKSWSGFMRIISQEVLSHSAFTAWRCASCSVHICRNRVKGSSQNKSSCVIP